MKFRTISIITAAALLSQSCLIGQKDIFSDTASGRMNKFIDGAQKVLVSAPTGWSMEYFTDLGGYIYAMKFDQNGEVSVSNELNPGTVETSYYKVTTDNGPVLSFDTYNSMMHYFATPSSYQYEALGGDFEFIILDYSDTEIKLKGKRSGRYAVMKPLTDGITVPEYTTKIANIVKDFLVLGFDCDINGNTDYSGTFDLENRAIVFGIYDQDGIVIGDEFSQQYIYTETGVRLYDTLSVAGVTFSKFDVEPSTNAIISYVEGVTMTARPIPADYCPFDLYPGDYTLKCGNSSYDVRVSVADEFAHTLNLEGIDKTKFNYEMYLYYSLNTGFVTAEAQILHVGEDLCRENEDEENYVALLAFSTSGSGSPYYNMKGVWNKNSTKPAFTFQTGVETANVDGFILWGYDEEGWGNQYTGKKFFPKELRPFTSLTRK